MEIIHKTDNVFPGPKDDNDCRTKCIQGSVATNGIASCVAACPKGNGTAIDNENYKSCLEDCVATAAVTASETGAAATGTATGTASGTGSGSNSDSSATGTHTSGSGSGTSTSASASASATKNAAGDLQVKMGASVAGAAGLLAAMLAL